MHTIPVDRAGRIEAVGRYLYGATWRAKMAASLGISRSSFYNWRRGKRATVEIDAELIDLVDRERDRSCERSVALTTLRRRLENASRQRQKKRVVPR